MIWLKIIFAVWMRAMPASRADDPAHAAVVRNVKAIAVFLFQFMVPPIWNAVDPPVDTGCGYLSGIQRKIRGFDAPGWLLSSDLSGSKIG
jgi:hypothetical protein